MSGNFWYNNQFGVAGFEGGDESIFLGPGGMSNGLGTFGLAPSPNVNNHGLAEGVRPLACPLFKSNKHQHRDCREKQIRHIADLRHHLLRNHGEPPIFCPTCKRVFNGNNNRHNKRDKHIRQASCRASSQPDPIWIPPELMARLHGESDRGATPEERRWYRIWDEIFGQISRYPDSCYHLSSATAELVNDAAEAFVSHSCLNQLVARLQQDIYAMYGPPAFGINQQIFAMVARRTISEFRRFFAHNEDRIGMPPG
ncbi:hypothetical protein QBC43DRAFT_311937 [Cladorrhinum sp. PSN259]|nr:hypothetical protein QBC43DRAFT_311937 [Cladorrhinum sp. PSN259]